MTTGSVTTPVPGQAENRGSGRPSERTAYLRARAPALGIGLVALVLAVVAGTAIGPVGIGPDIVVKVLLNHVAGTDIKVDDAFDAIIWDIRLPRVLLAGVVGATLGWSGAAYQGVFRNPLADPYLLGVASGAGLAATVVVVTHLPLEAGGLSLITLAAFGGALAAVALTYSLARVGGHTPNTTLILAGVAVSSVAGSLISFLMLESRESTTTILTWLLGGLNRAGWHQMLLILPYTLPAGLVVLVHGRVLNTLQLDEHQARQVGIDVERTKLLILAAASLGAASAVAVAGIIGFVGLIAPHVVRLILGPDYRRLIPMVALLGASFLIVADLGARMLLSPGELPVGVITSMVGVPFFLVLLRRQKRAFF